MFGQNRSLKENVIGDLHRHFKVKLKNAKVYSCLVYDFLFINLVVNPFYVITWRGTWTNADYLLDVVIFKGDLYSSTVAAFVTGTVGAAIILWGQHGIQKFAGRGGRLRFLLVSRIFTIFQFYHDVLIWKGIWGLLHYLFGSHWKFSLAAFLGATAVLIGFKCFKSTLMAPVVSQFDRPKTYISVPTFFSTNPYDMRSIRALDILVTLFFTLVAITAFYGAWTGGDHYFDDLGEPHDKKIEDGLWRLVIGYPCTVFVFLVQFPLLYLHHSPEQGLEGGATVGPTAAGTMVLQEGVKLELSNERPHDMKVIFHHGSAVHNTWQLTAAYQLMLVVALVGDVFIFRGLWVLLENSFLTHDLVLSRTICQFGGILALFLLYSGSSLHGGVSREGHRQQDGILLPTFFSTYFMADKVSEGEEEEEGGGRKKQQKENEKGMKKDPEENKDIEREEEQADEEERSERKCGSSSCSTKAENVGFEESEL